MANKYDAIFCDLGNVLVNFDHRIAVKKILDRTGKNQEDIYQLFFDSGLTKLYEEGKVSSSDFFQKVKDSLGLGVGMEEFFAIWDDIFFETPLNLKIQNFLRGVKGKYKLAMISNINENHFGFLRKKMSIFEEFDKLILSYEVGFRKPAREIYNAALKALDTRPEKVFYIDDRADLIKAASGYGINGVTFDGEEAFEKITQELSGM